MRLLLDSSVLIDHLRGREGAIALLAAAAREGHELWSVTVVRTEVLGGARQREEGATAQLLARLRWLPVDSELADTAGELGRRYLPAYAGIDAIDLLVAAAARKLDAELRTLNVRHFPMFEGLRSAY